MVTVALTPEQKRQAVEAVEKYGNIPAAWNALSDAGLLEPRGLTEPASSPLPDERQSRA